MALLLCRRLVLARPPALSNPVRHNGFIVLVPEIGEDLPEKNPLLHNNGLPEFNNVTIENCMATVASQTLGFETGVKEIETELIEKGTSNVFDDVLTPLEVLGAPLDMTWGLSKTLYLGNSTLMPTKSYLAIHDRAKRARACKFNSLPIYEACKQELLASSGELTDEQGRTLRKFVLEGKLNGLELDENNKGVLDRTLGKMAQHRMVFRQKIDVVTKQFSHVIEDGTVVRDFPEDLLKVTATDSKNYMKGPWKVTLEPQICLPVMEACHDRNVRWNIWRALVNRGSGYGNQDYATGVDLEEIRYARRDVAKLLGYETFADMSMETKMAGSVANVQGVVRELMARAKPAQDRELDSLYQFALERGFKGSRIELWDVPYWRRKQVRTLYDYREDDFADYFQFPIVLDGLFALSEKLFNIVIKQRSNVSTWHKDVKYYDIFESHSSAPIGGFYVDPYATNENATMRSKGWMVSIQSQSRITDTKPLAALIFDFRPPSGDRPSLMTWQDLKSLFHKFGLVLQHVLSRTNYSEVSGSSNIEWDAVEVSGHVLSHFLHDRKTIESISSHCDSQDTLPDKMFHNLINSHNHLAGTDLSRELYLASLDLELHQTKDYWLDVVKRVWPEFRSFPLDKNDAHPCSFTQIFCEEWAAAYYSHVWSRMIAADVYSAFHEVSGDEQKTVDVGKRFRDTFLMLGGSCHPGTVFRRFRGRDPSPRALLKSLGLRKPQKVE